MNNLHRHSDQLSVQGTKGFRQLILALIVNVALTFVQIIGGLVSGSLALIADALHNLSDAGSLFIALIARKWAMKPADKQRTFGYKRAELIGALINLTTLILIGCYLLYEGVLRWFQQEPVDGWIVVIIAGIALVIDVVTACLTFKLSKNSLNIRAAFLHNIADALSSIAVIVAGTVIILFGWNVADAICTLMISAYVIYYGYSEMRTVIRILMQSTPTDININSIVLDIENISNVKQIHHVHVWDLDEVNRALEAHIFIDYQCIDNMEVIKKAIKRLLSMKYDICHTTLEFEFNNDQDRRDCNDNMVISPH